MKTLTARHYASCFYTGNTLSYFGLHIYPESIHFSHSQEDIVTRSGEIREDKKVTPSEAVAILKAMRNSKRGIHQVEITG